MTVVAKPTQTQSFETLDIQVKGLEVDVRDLKDSIVGLDAKLDKSIASLAHEVRSAVSALTSQFTERGRTPWAVLIAAAGFGVVLLGGIGLQQIVPIQNDIKSLKDIIVPRAEVTYRSEINTRRFAEISASVELLEQRRYQELREEILNLRKETMSLRSQQKVAPP